MLHINRKCSSLALFLLTANLAYPAYSANYKKPVRNFTVEKHPQNFRKPAPSPTPTPDFANDISEINKTNGSIKQDVLLMRETVNNLSKELNDEKTRNNENINKQKELENNSQRLMIILLVTIFFLLIALYMIYSKMKKDSEKSVKEKIDSFVKDTKTEILKDFKINETDFYAYTENITGKKMEEFENVLDTRFGDYNRKITTTTEKEISEFKNGLESDLKKQLEEFSSSVENKFTENKEKFLAQIEEKFPGSDMGNVIVNLAQENGLLNNINTQLENNVTDIISKEFGKIEKHLANKEKMIVADIQKVHLANNHFNIGNIFMKNKSYKQAIAEFLQAIKTDSEFYGAYINLGIAYENNNENDQAIDTYKKAIELKPEHYKAYFNLGNLYKKLEKYDDALNIYKKAIEINPKNFKLYNNLGIVYQMLKDNDQALTNYQKAIEINPNYADAYVNLAKTESVDGNDIYFIAEKYLKNHNAKQDTFYKVKELAYSVVNNEDNAVTPSLKKETK